MGGTGVSSWDYSSGHCLGGGDDLMHAAGAPAADVVGTPGARLARSQGEDERASHVGHVHEVADRGALAIDDQLRRLALVDGQESGNEPGGVTVGVCGQGSGDVEGAQADRSDRPLAARSVAAWSAASLLVPYGLLGASTAVSLIGCSSCSPYTAQVEARTIRRPGALASLSRMARVPPRLVRQ